MYYRQKLGYIVLGAVITLIGIGFSAFFATPLIAQDSGWFDRIICSELIVVGDEGRPGIILSTTPEGASSISLANTAEDDANLSINLIASHLETVFEIFNSRQKRVFHVDAARLGTDLKVNNADGTSALHLRCDGTNNQLDFYGSNGNKVISFQPHHPDNSAGITLADDAGTDRIKLGYDNNIRIYDSTSQMVWQAPEFSNKR